MLNSLKTCVIYALFCPFCVDTLHVALYYLLVSFIFYEFSIRMLRSNVNTKDAQNMKGSEEGIRDQPGRFPLICWRNRFH